MGSRMSKKEKGLVDMDNSVVTAGSHKGDKWLMEKYNKNKQLGKIVHKI